MSSSELRRLIARLLVVRGSGHARDSQRRYPRWELTNAELHRLLDAGVGGLVYVVAALVLNAAGVRDLARRLLMQRRLRSATA